MCFQGKMSVLPVGVEPTSPKATGSKPAAFASFASSCGESGGRGSTPSPRTSGSPVSAPGRLNLSSPSASTVPDRFATKCASSKRCHWATSRRSRLARGHLVSNQVPSPSVGLSLQGTTPDGALCVGVQGFEPWTHGVKSPLLWPSELHPQDLWSANGDSAPMTRRSYPPHTEAMALRSRLWVLVSVIGVSLVAACSTSTEVAEPVIGAVPTATNAAVEPTAAPPAPTSAALPPATATPQPDPTATAVPDANSRPYSLPRPQRRPQHRSLLRRATTVAWLARGA